ncbi:type IV secretory system conjugative DNA transfer family protein [Cellulophaga baltica]|uniref:TraM recognition site of TraD and TraG n=1 Tax=Cellulophaga baltica TaxID=76594 RepID=A0A1G7EDD9_9FLAO|nr:type IV secretory system conjugative DNA transfer family protein [Cellulophaga baltica]SDE61466.1 TraM recognition site of TraD and TraG [Cellulophaga baltica]
MPLDNLLTVLLIIGLTSTVFYGMFRITKYAFAINAMLLALLVFYIPTESALVLRLLYLGCPLMLLNIGLYVFMHKTENPKNGNTKYQVNFATTKGNFKLENIKRGASVIGSAGSGKTESVVYGFLKHFQKEGFCGIIHDYKDFELTEMAYPLFKDGDIPFKVISFDKIIHRVNPIAPLYLENEESVNEVSRVLIENLLEQRESGTTGTSKFFNDAAEGLIGGLIWKLKTTYPQFCTLPHLIAIYQYLDTNSLIQFLETNTTSRAMADAFISGKDSERQTAGVKSTLANALKRISTQRIFMALSEDEVPLNINHKDNPTVISIVNNPKFETSYSPVIATIYVMQDKIQNDMMYGDKASKAILSNLSYQFFGKVNDPDTAKYYERFFEIIKDPTKSVSRGYNLDFDTRVTTGEKEIPKIRADVFFRLKQGEFITYADGKDKKVQFKLQNIKRELPNKIRQFSRADLEANFERIYEEAKSIFTA